MKKLLISTIAVALLPLILVAASTDKGHGAWLGIYPQTIDKDLKEAFNLDYSSGVIINSIVPDSPADEAGLKQGDIIIRLDGKTIDDADKLIEIVRNHHPGDDIKLMIISNNRKKTIYTTLGSFKDSNYPAISVFKSGGIPHIYSKFYSSTHSSMSNCHIGVTLETLNNQLGKYFGVEDGKGALITEVLEDSPAEKTGLKAGDVIIEIDGEEITEIFEIQNLVSRKEEGEIVDITILREKKKKEFSVEIEESPDYFQGHTPRMHSLPDWDSFDRFLPPMKGLLRSDYDDDFFDIKDLRESMEQLQEDMKRLQKEIREVKLNME